MQQVMNRSDIAEVWDSEEVESDILRHLENGTFAPERTKF
jgi:hypothetical protein